MCIRDSFLTSVAAALRAVKAHRPTVVVADGQGGLVALGLANALCLETCLAMRNVQLPEIPPLAKAWGAIRAVIVSTPRWGKASLDVERLRRAVPEMFDLLSPWEGLPTAFVATKHSPLHAKEMELCERLRLVTVPKIQDVLLLSMLERPAKLMWEHNGKCICGRRTFLHGLCDKCAREDAIDRHQAAAQEPEPQDTEVLDDPDATLAVTDLSLIHI